jgi:hypothetical protein
MPAVRFDPDREIEEAQARLRAATAYVSRRRELDEAWRAACDAGVTFDDTPPALRPAARGAMLDAVAAAPTQPLAPATTASLARARSNATRPADLLPNTLLRYSYTPRGGAETQSHAVVVAGPAAEEDFASSLAHGRYFLASQVGLPEARAHGVAPTAADHAWSRLDAVVPTTHPITQPLAARALRARFRAAAATGWDEATALRQQRIPSAPLLSPQPRARAS